MYETWIALIPAYEPDARLIDLLREVEQAGFEPFVVDDGSGAAFADLFQTAAAYATVLTHKGNLGKGQALKTGLSEIQKKYRKDYVVVTLDADGQHTVADALRVCQAAQLHPDTLVLGSRSLKEGKIPLRSRLGNGITRWVYRLAAGRRIHDTQTGLRAFSSQLLPALSVIDGQRYEYEMNVLLECTRKNIPMQEVAIETIYINNNETSHFSTLRDSCRIYRTILRFSLSSFAGFLVDYAMYFLLLALTVSLGTVASLWVSNIGARITSAAVNYTLNRTLVFRSRTGIARTALQYAALAAGILLGNTLMLTFLATCLGINRFVAKICTELLFFFLNWFVQHRLIFRDPPPFYKHAKGGS